MGMAASQARLLMITARMHDVEYQAQSIQNAKIQLATKSDEVYKDYLAALDATTLTVKDSNGNTIAANFNNLWGRNAVDTVINKYAIQDEHGNLIVSEDIKEAYDNYMTDKGSSTSSPYAFAIYMIGGKESVQLDKLEKNCDEVYADISKDSDIIASNAYKAIASAKKDMKDLLNGKDYNDLKDKDKEKYDKAEKTYYNLMYTNYAEKIYNKNVGANSANDYEKFGIEEYNSADFNYYVNIFRQIQACGGCVSITDFDGGLGGDAANDGDWLKDQIENGRFSISIVNTNKKTGEVDMSTTSIATDSFVGTTTTTSIDKRAYAKAEAEYEHETKAIDAKDKKYDMELSKLETEREALKTQYDSTKKVISDNIERTFGIFS